MLLSEFVYTYTYIHIYIYICIRIDAYIIFVCVYTYTYMCMYTCTGTMMLRTDLTYPDTYSLVPKLFTPNPRVQKLHVASIDVSTSTEERLTLFFNRI